MPNQNAFQNIGQTSDYKRDVEFAAYETLIKYSPRYFKGRPAQTPVEDIAVSVFNLEIEFVSITNNGRVLGKTVFDDGITFYYNTEKRDYDFLQVKKGTILLDSTLLPGNGGLSMSSKYSDHCEHRMNFTLAHELGHWVLHRKLFEENNADLSSQNPNGNNDPAENSQTNSFMEWQANYFANCLLLPTPMVEKYYRILKKLNPNDCGGIALNYQELLSAMSNRFAVSKQVMDFKLSHLKKELD